MKVFSAPVEAPDFDMYRGPDGRLFDFETMQRVDDAYLEACELALRDLGFNGKRTGKLFQWGVADGSAIYMVMESSTRTPRFALAHLRLHDAYQLPAAHERGLTKADILRQVDAKPLFGERR